MPVYDFKCLECEMPFEERFSSYQVYEKETVKCPKCDSEKVEKLISTGTTAIFKGPGFYVNDYKRRGR